MIVEFTVAGEPQSKGRPKFAKRGNYAVAYTPEKTAIYENLIKLEYERQCPNKRFGDKDALTMVIQAFFKMPISTPKHKHAGMMDGTIRPVKKPDWDNIGKIVADSLNGIAYRDDSQIATAIVEKYYDDDPRLMVWLFDDAIGRFTA